MPNSPVVFQYADLANPDADVSDLIEQAFGPAGLGICTVSGVPGFPQLRSSLLPLAAQLAALPQGVKARYEDAASQYNFGWSCGREVLEGGRPDTHKGSWYANPLIDDPTAGDPTLAAAHPAYARPNLWPRDELPALEASFKALGRLMCGVGLLLAHHCDKYVTSKLGSPLPRSLHSILAESPCPKGRLLHYFAHEEPAAAAAAAAADGDGGTNWCGWHYDNGSLTGLTSALYLDAAGQPTACADPQAGLHIKDRSGRMVHAAIPPEHIGFQVGEAMQIHSGGLLRGTPHCVVAPRPELSTGVSRETFAVFMQPKWDVPLQPPPGVQPEAVGIGQWQPGLTFGEHSARTFDVYYAAQQEQQA